MMKADSMERPSGGRKEPHEISVVRFLNLLLRNRRILLLAPVVGLLLGVLATRLMPATYTSTGTFLPETADARHGRLAGLAAQFGVDLAIERVGESPKLYADLFTSSSLLKAAVETHYEVGGASGSGGDLVRLFGVRGDVRAQQVDEAMRRLRNRARAHWDPEAGMIRLRVTTRNPELSRVIAVRMLELVNEFNLQTRQTRAKHERQFIEERLAEAQAELLAAEKALQRFLEENRRYEHSPQLRFEYDRLHREVQHRQQLVSSLSQSLERARIEEVREMPVVTLVDPPERPVRADARGTGTGAAVGFLAGLLLSLCWASGREIIRWAGSDSESSEHWEFRALRGEARSEIVQLGRRLRRPFASRFTPD